MRPTATNTASATSTWLAMSKVWPRERSLACKLSLWTGVHHDHDYRSLGAMTKYAIVPVEPPEEILSALAMQLWITLPSVAPGCMPDREQIKNLCRAVLTTRPELDASMQAALELAREWKLAIQERRNLTITPAQLVEIRDALLRAAGEETP